MKIKASLRSSAIVWDFDAYYFRSQCSSYNTSLKMQTQNFKDSFCYKVPKFKDLKYAPLCNNITEPAKKKDKKKKFQEYRQKRTKE